MAASASAAEAAAFASSAYPSLPLDSYREQCCFHHIRTEWPGVQLINENPYIFLVHYFVTPTECRALMDLHASGALDFSPPRPAHPDHAIRNCHSAAAAFSDCSSAGGEAHFNECVPRSCRGGLASAANSGRDVRGTASARAHKGHALRRRRVLSGAYGRVVPPRKVRAGSVFLGPMADCAVHVIRPASTGLLAAPTPAAPTPVCRMWAFSARLAEVDEDGVQEPCAWPSRFLTCFLYLNDVSDPETRRRQAP